MTEKQKIYHELNKRNPNLGICSCGKPKPWNEEKGKYEYYCGTPEHKAKMRQDYQNNMKKKHGTDNMLNDPEVQRKMMAGRKIAKRYRIQNKEYVVLSQLEYKTLEQLDRLGYKAKDIDAPATFNISYQDPRTGKTKIHIPDVFVHSLNLIISVKDGLENPNKHPNFQKDRVKSLLEYKSILGNTDYNYVQIEGYEDIKALKSILGKVKDMHYKKARYLMPPVVDVEMLVRESAEFSPETSPQTMFDILCIGENERAWITSNDDLLIGTFVCIDDKISEVMVHNIEEPKSIHYNLGAISHDYDLDLSMDVINNNGYSTLQYIKESIVGSNVKNSELVEFIKDYRMIQSLSSHSDIREVMGVGE